MKLKSIRISNILSFAETQAPEDAREISFDTAGTIGSLHILIGPNGAGKSNFVEIIGQVFNRTLFTQPKLELTLLRNVLTGALIEEDSKRQILTRDGDQLSFTLAPHWDSRTAPMALKLQISLNKEDGKNLKLLLDNCEYLNKVLSEYSNLGIQIPNELNRRRLYRTREVSLDLKYQPGGQLQENAFANTDSMEVSFIHDYLRHFLAFQFAIAIHNESHPDDRLPALKNTFTFLGAYRNYSGVTSQIPFDSSQSVRDAQRRVKNESTRRIENAEPSVFELFKRQLGIRFYQLSWLDGKISSDEALERILTEEPVASINRLLKKYLQTSLRLRRTLEPNRIEAFFVGERDEQVSVEELSAGQKAILHFIFILYGLDLRNGMIIIDEPEIHLHPQFQKQYLEIIVSEAERLNLQIILATHSPVFVEARTISKTYRFYKQNRATKVVQPPMTPTGILREQDLSRILDLTNASKIFFVNQAILVEGDTDEYFFRFYLNYLRSNDTGDWHHRIEDYEVFNIKGKGQRPRWTSFLQGFGLKVAFLGDWDNINEITTTVGLANKCQDIWKTAIGQTDADLQDKPSRDSDSLVDAIYQLLEDLTETNKQHLRKITDYVVRRRLDYPSLIRCIQAEQPEFWQEIEAAILASRADDIYILRNGELEHYLGIKRGLEHVIRFCQNDFEVWLSDPKFNEHRAELDTILQQVFPAKAAPLPASTDQPS